MGGTSRVASLQGRQNVVWRKNGCWKYLFIFIIFRELFLLISLISNLNMETYCPDRY